MKHSALSFVLLWLLLTGCREVDLSDVVKQRVLINDFSQPIRTSLAEADHYPVYLTYRVNGTISRPVKLTVYRLSGPQKGGQVAPATDLSAGTYNNRKFQQDFYESAPVELVITAEPGTTGSLDIEWSR